MLPPGHIAAGYLVGHFLSEQFGISGHYAHTITAIAMTSAFAPDLDMFLDFAKNKHLTLDTKKDFHRAYITHTPLLWIALGLLVATLVPTGPGKTFALAITLGGLSHLLLDMGAGGVRLFWPFSQKFYALTAPGHNASTFDRNKTKNFFLYWARFLKIYASDKVSRTTFVAEVTVIIAATVVYFT